MQPSHVPRPFYFNQHALNQYPPSHYHNKEQLQESYKQPYNNLMNSQSYGLSSHTISPNFNLKDQSTMPFNNMYFSNENAQHFNNSYRQQESIPNHIQNSIEDLLKFPPPKINITQPIQRHVIDSSNIPSQNISYSTQPPVNNFVQFPPPNINSLQPLFNDFLSKPPPRIILNSPNLIHPRSNVFNSQKIYHNQNSVNSTSLTKDISGNNCSFPGFISGVDNLDKLYMIDFTEKIKKRLNLKCSNKICLKKVFSQTEEMKKLEESLTAINNCPYFNKTIKENCLETRICSNTEAKINNIENIESINCLCSDIVQKNNLIIMPFDHSQIFQEINNKMKELKSELNEDIIKKAALKYKIIRKKRDRLKRNKQMRILENENSLKRREIIEKKFDDWQQNIAAEEKIIKEKLELQKAVETTMSEVRLKISDLNKQMKLLNQLKKLRKLRAERRKKNDMSTEEFNITTKNFELRTRALEKLINDQMSTYKDEEHTLKVMLDIEAEVDAELKLRRQKKDVQIRTSLFKKQINEYLFGQKLDVKFDDPMFSFYKHYKMADTNIESFLAIRSEWDNCVVSKDVENSSSVNLAYFVPSPPSNPKWAECLIK